MVAGAELCREEAEWAIDSASKLCYMGNWVKVNQSRYRPGVGQRVPGS